MPSEWRQEKFSKCNVGNKMRLRVWNKHQKIDLVFMQLTRYKCAKDPKYQLSPPEQLADNQLNVSNLKYDMQILLRARVCSSPAAWAKEL